MKQVMKAHWRYSWDAMNWYVVFTAIDVPGRLTRLINHKVTIRYI